MRSAAFSSLCGYRRAWVSADLLAAATLWVIVVPEQLATSRLAGMPPITGFYAFVAGSVLFAAFGSSPQLSVGADSTIAPLFAAGVGTLAAVGSPRYAELVAVLAVMVGVFVAAVGLLRLGWIAEFLSAPIISGFLGGVSVIIVVHQLPALLGIPSVQGSALHRLVAVLGHLGEAQAWTVALGVGTMVTILVADRLDTRLPGALLALVGSTALVAALNLQDRGVAVLGPVASTVTYLEPQGLTWSVVRSLVPVAAVVALVVVSQTAATTRGFADRGGYAVDLDRDFLGVGAGNVVAGLIGAFPVNASPPRTSAVASASGRTQVTGLMAAVGIVILIPVAWILRDVPLATLAGVLIVVAARIFHLHDLVDIARFDLFELGLTLVTLVTVTFLGVEQGIAVAVGLAILDRTRLSARPQVHVMGRIPGTTSWAPMRSVDPVVAQEPGVLVVLFATPLWYANAVHFRDELIAAKAQAQGRLRLIVLDAVGMSDLDYTGSRVLNEVLDQLDREQVQLVLARVEDGVRTSLTRSGLLDRIGAEHLYPSVDAAVASPLGPGPA